MDKKRKFENIAEEVKRARKEKGISQTDLSHRLGYLNGQFISNVERGKCNIPPHKLRSLCAYLKIPKQVLVEAMVEDYESYLNSF